MPPDYSLYHQPHQSGCGGGVAFLEYKFKHHLVDYKCNTHDIDSLAFIDDLVKSELITNPKADVSQLCEHYHATLKTLLDKHVPV